MCNIKENQVLELSNVISYRAKMNQQRIQTAMEQIGEIIKKSGAVKAGNIVTATYSVEVAENEQVMDIEILIPLDKKISVPEGYMFKPVFRLTNALSIRHEGNPQLLQRTVVRLNDFIVSNNLQVITGTYNVTVKEPAMQSEIENMIVDIYVGLNPNIL